LAHGGKFHRNLTKITKSSNRLANKHRSETEVRPERIEATTYTTNLQRGRRQKLLQRWIDAAIAERGKDTVFQS
jgi:hypothetical protein